MRKLPESAWLEAAIRVAADEYGGPDEDGAYANNIEAIECGFAFADELRRQYEARADDAAGTNELEELRRFASMVANTDHTAIVPDISIVEGNGEKLLRETIEGLANEALRVLGLSRPVPAIPLVDMMIATGNDLFHYRDGFIGTDGVLSRMPGGLFVFQTLGPNGEYREHHRDGTLISGGGGPKDVVGISRGGRLICGVIPKRGDS